MALVSTTEIQNFLGIPAGDVNITLIQSSVEDWIQTVFCRKTFEVTSYKERYNGTGTPYLYVDNYPIVSLSRLAVLTDNAINITNTVASAYATVSIDSTTLTLCKDGVNTLITLASYPTLAQLVAAINAVTGWSAALEMTTYSSYPTSVLQPRMGLSCGNNRTVYLEMPDDGEYDFEIRAKEGEIYLAAGFPEGENNVYVEYTAGYATIPDDIKLATLILIKNIYQRRIEESFGNTSYSVSGISLSFETDIPQQAKQILEGYRRFIV